MTQALVDTVGQLATLLQVALETHEQLEASGEGSPVGDVCGALGFAPGAVPMEHLASALFAFTLFGEPTLCRSQEALHTALRDALPMAERMIFRQVRTQPLRAWRYLAQPSSRDVVRQLAGPAAELEELADGLLDLATGPVPAGGACLGWPVNVNGLHIIVAACLLTDDAVARIEHLAPFPMPDDEHAFWADQLEAVLRAAIDPMDVLAPRPGADDRLAPDAFRDGEVLVIQPAVQPHQLLERIILAADFELVRGRTDWYRQKVKRVRHLRETIAAVDPASGERGLEPVVEVLVELRHHLLGYAGQSRFAGPTDPALEAWLPMERILAGFGIVDATMPGATEAQNRQLASELLLLDDQHPIALDVHGREPIRAALEWAAARPADDPHAASVSEAWHRLRQERRWAATYSALDLDDEGHLLRIDLAEVAHALHHTFDPRALEMPLAGFDIDARQLGWLESALRPKPYTDANPLSVGHVPLTEARLLELRNLGPIALFQVKRALLDAAQTWRARRLGQEPRFLRVQARAQQVASGGSEQAETLEDGLAELAALFGES